MEGVQSERVPESDSASPASPRLSGDLPSKDRVDNMEIENPAESFEGVEGGEIMVEVVGSDVFVDGVISHQEGDLGSGEVECLEEPRDRISSEEKAAPGGKSGNQILDCVTHLSEPRDEKVCVTESGEASVLLSTEDGVLNGNGNQLTEAVAASLLSETDNTAVANDHMEVGIDESLDLVNDISFTTGADTENVDFSGADAPLLSEAVGAGEDLQTAPSGASEIVEFDDVLDFGIGSSNVSAELSSTSNEKCFDSDVNFIADKVHHAHILPNDSGADEVSECETPFENQHHTEARVSGKNEADYVKSNGILLGENPDPGKSTNELEGELVIDSSPQAVDSDKLTGEFSPAVNEYTLLDEETRISSRPLNMGQSSYLSAPEKEGLFSVGDLVWGKVSSHPWWPGQIFDQADASDEAIKYYSKDSHLVAYFGDQTFAWNDSSLLKPFRSYFTHMEKQSNSEEFRDAVTCALEEVSRRVQLGLSCSCISQDAYSKIESQCVRNSGIRQASSQRSGVDKSCKALHFQPMELLLFIRELAPRSSLGGNNHLDLVLARAQLSAFCHFKGYRLPPEFFLSEEMVENDLGAQQKNNKHTPVDAAESPRERSLSDLMDLEFSLVVESDTFPDDVGISVSFPVSKKRKADFPLGDGPEKRASTYAARVSTPASQAPKASFRIGECISRVASKLTAPESDDSLKIYELSDRPTMVVSAESSSLDEVLSQIQVLGCQPSKEHSFPLTTRTFLLGFRNSIALSKQGKKQGSETASVENAEEFDFHDINDAYWTDRIVQNYSPEQLQNGDNSAGTLEMAPFVADSVLKPARKSRKRFSNAGLPSVAAVEPHEITKKHKQDSSPAELTLNFEDSNRVPSEVSLNKIFRRFGALMESETEVDHASGRARVIFKRGFDAEVARDSSEKFNLFGPATVSYQVGYSPLISVKISPIAPQPVGDESWIPNAIA